MLPEVRAYYRLRFFFVGDYSTLRLTVALRYCLFIRAMVSSVMLFGQTASHDAILVQSPNPSASICETMFRTRRSCSTLPCGRRLRWETLAATNNIAEAFLHAATQAPQPMQAASSKASSASSFGIGMALPSGAPPVETET